MSRFMFYVLCFMFYVLYFVFCVVFLLFLLLPHSPVSVRSSWLWWLVEPRVTRVFISHL